MFVAQRISVWSSSDTVAVARGLQLFEEVGQALDVIAVDLGPVLVFLGNSSVMRCGMVGGCDAGFRIDPHAHVVCVHQRRDARDVGLERQRLQIPHQLDVFGRTIPAFRRAPARRATDRSPSARCAGAVRFRECRPDIHSGGRGPCPGSLPFRRATSCVTASSRLALACLRAMPLLRVAAIAEQALENHLRIRLVRQRLGGTRPGHRIHVRATVAPRARGERALIFDAKLDRRQRVILPDASARSSGRSWCRDRCRR